MFKCPDTFCIPWSYACDGKWDCPNGIDEAQDTLCRTKGRNCTNLFKCRNSQICVHFTDVCDSKSDCPLADEEFLCLLQFALCPPNCECLTFAVACIGVVIPSQHDFNNYRIIQLENSTFSLTATMDNLVCLTVQVSVLLGSICEIMSHMPHLVFLSAPNNQISYLL